MEQPRSTAAAGVDEAVREAVADRLAVSPDVLTVDVDLVSLGVTDDDAEAGLLAAVEDRLDVRFPDDFLDGVTTFGQFTSAVKVAIGA